VEAMLIAFQLGFAVEYSPSISNRMSMTWDCHTFDASSSSHGVAFELPVVAAGPDSLPPDKCRHSLVGEVFSLAVRPFR